MTNTCLKKDFRRLGNEIEDLIKMEDSAHGTLCAIHKTIHSTDNFPCSRHKMLRLCSAPPHHHCSGTKAIRPRKKTRSISPCYNHPKMQNKTITISVPRVPCATPTESFCMSEGSELISPRYHKTNYVNVAKTISCPEKMCCHATASNKTFGSSSLQLDRFAQSILNTDGIVSELKGEIEKVKHQLQSISYQQVHPTKSRIPRATCLKADEYEGQLTKLRNENKRLKREVDSKRKLLDRYKSDVEKAKEILVDYERKVGLLHTQALKSAKAMKISKEKFCSCLKDRDEKIRCLKDSNNLLVSTIKERDSALEDKTKELNQLSEGLDSLKNAFEETCEKCSALNESNQNFYESIEMLRQQLENSSTEIDTQNETIQKLEQKICDLTCSCKKLTAKAKKQREMYENELKSYNAEKVKMHDKISDLSLKLIEGERQKSIKNKLECECKALKEKLLEYRKYQERCKSLEDDCKRHYESLVASRTCFEKDKEEMNKLIDELKTTVQKNEVTISQMTDINKQQENIIQCQSIALMTKEEQLKIMETESNELKVQSAMLQQEVGQLRKTLSEPCSREACLSTSKQLEEIRYSLNAEKDRQLLKEKIIEDQSQTIVSLQSQVKEKMSELTQAQSDTKYLESEINKINDKLFIKHNELDREIDEKEKLLNKLRVLESQKNQLTEELNDFVEMLQSLKKTCGDNQKQQKLLKVLENQIEEQKREWEAQKQIITKEKQKAVYAAKFASKQLLDTVADFERQVEAQRKVQGVLTKMIHEKDKKLRIATSKIASINSITKEPSENSKIRDRSMKELFVRKSFEQSVPSDINTNTSIYSSCSSCCRRQDAHDCPEIRLLTTKENEKYSNRMEKVKRSADTHSEAACLAACAEINQIYNLISKSMQNIQEEPSRDFS